MFSVVPARRFAGFRDKEMIGFELWLCGLSDVERDLQLFRRVSRGSDMSEVGQTVMS